MSEEFVRGHCPNCGPNRVSNVVGHHIHDVEDDESEIWITTHFRILQCRGCEAGYFQRETIFSEDIDHKLNRATGEYEAYIPSRITYFPSPSKREIPDWSFQIDVSDDVLGGLFTDLYTALDADLRVLAAISARTIFDRASELLGVNVALTFEDKIKKLHEIGKISTDELEVLKVLTDAGSAAAHRAWKPSPPQIDTMMQIVENFLHRTFIIGKAAKELQAKIPPKQR